MPTFAAQDRWSWVFSSSLMPDSLCFICGAPAIQTVNVPAAGWGSAFPQAMVCEVPACTQHAVTPTG